MHTTGRAVLIDVDRPGPPLRPVEPAWPPAGPLDIGLRHIAAAAAAAGIRVLGTSRHHDPRDVWAAAHDRAVHIDDVWDPSTINPATANHTADVALVATRPDGPLAARLPQGIRVLDPADVTAGDDADDPDGPLAWAVPRDGWQPIRHVHDPDVLHQLLTSGWVHPGSRPAAQDRLASHALPDTQRRWPSGRVLGMTGERCHLWPSRLMRIDEVLHRPWTAMRLATHRLPRLLDLDPQLVANRDKWDDRPHLIGPLRTLGPYTQTWQTTLWRLKNWWTADGWYRSGPHPLPHLLLLPAVCIAADITRQVIDPSVAVVSIAAHRWSADRPAQTSQRLGRLVGLLTGRTHQTRDGTHGMPDRFVLLDDQITRGDTIRNAAIASRGRCVGIWSITASPSRIHR
ncbi:hypothetical protein DVS28_b0022 (plasmid) [Euzebya pacifica]|uniref:Uncharacterized protein n=1 Tax=Euzebya pacifica TaxID=1608957 RepID=A0A346Y5P5_9ACTN|nr:hypothetical protein [Euzebya pacifica]AXV09792.1 hypothetical protein DVS28_b0022 [Euzebya pacifica]